MPRSKASANPLFPVTILVDSREQRVYPFDAIPADAQFGGGTWQVKTERVALPSGDYSLDGYATAIAIERKSKADLYHTISQDRERFIRELERLNEMAFAVVMVEAEWSEILTRPPEYSQMEPKTVFRSMLAWQQRYPRVHWWFAPGRDVAEVVTFRILERFLKEQAENSFRKPKV